LRQGLISAGKGACEGKADAQGEQGIQRIGRHLKIFRYTTTGPCIANLAGCRHSILKERLTSENGTAARTWLETDSAAGNRTEVGWRMAYLAVIRPPRAILTMSVHDHLFVRPAARTRFAPASPQPFDPDP